jgi:GNAT superfamily N-acetyltransferase
VFYEADLPMDRTEFLWHRFFSPDDPVSCIVAEVEDSVVGIAHFFPHPDTWEDGPVCYLQDLYVAETHRRTGVATSLIREVHRRCRHNNWRLLYWTTKADNTRARSLYDALTGGTNGHVVYDMEIPRL